MNRLPDDSLTRTTPGVRERAAQASVWPVSTELLAQVVDLLAILATDRRIKGEPRQVKRPDFLTRPATAGPARFGESPEPARQDGFAHAIGVLRATSRSTFVMPQES